MYFKITNKYLMTNLLHEINVLICPGSKIKGVDKNYTTIVSQ